MRMTTAMLKLSLTCVEGPLGAARGRVYEIRGILAHPAAQARKAAGALFQRLHHHPCLLEILEQAIHLGHRRAAARGDALAPAAVDQARLPPLLGRHGEQDRLVTL